MLSGNQGEDKQRIPVSHSRRGAIIDKEAERSERAKENQRPSR
jgi:hypothetical protein